MGFYFFAFIVGIKDISATLVPRSREMAEPFIIAPGLLKLG